MEKSPNLFTSKKSGHNIRSLPRSYSHTYTTGRCYTSRLEFRAHATSALRGGTFTSHTLKFLVHPINIADELCRWIGTWISGVQPVDICQQNKQICIHKRGHHCRKGIVVTKAIARGKIIHCHDIVLIYNRQYPIGQQTPQRITSIQIAYAAPQITLGQKSLGDRHTLGTK